MTEFAYSIDSPALVKADVLVLPVFQGPEPGPGVRDVKGLELIDLYREAKLKGKKGDNLLVPNPGVEGLAARSVFLVGVGRKEKATPDALRRAIGRIAPQLARRATVATTFPQAAGRAFEEAVQATVEGLLLGAYRFDRYKSGKGEDGAEGAVLKDVTVIGSPRWNARAVRAAIARGEIVADAVCWARDLVNAPALDCTPEYLAQQARAMAKEVGLKAKIWTEKELERGGFGGVIGVGRGSANPPRLIELEYAGAGARQAPIALTGKGVTFDSGGLSLKDPHGMEWMKADMAGAAAILAAMKAIARLRAKVNVIAAIPCAENMPGGSAIRPGDVLVHRGGKTSEVMNTDSEGRLLLADSLAYLAERNPTVMIDAATLGPSMGALGTDIFGVVGNDRGLVREVLAAGEAAGEPGWEFPLWEPYRRWIDSNVADVKNTSGKRYGGPITAGWFLAEFVGDTPWVHIDVAGPAFSNEGGDHAPKGATGVPVRTLVRFVLGRASRAARKRR